MTHPPQSANGRRAERQHQLSQATALTRSAAAAIAQQQQLTQPDDLLQQVEEHLLQQQHALKTADLIDALITRYPTCPKFVSLLVDRLVAGDEALAKALRSEGIG